MEKGILTIKERSRQVKDYITANFCEMPTDITHALSQSRAVGLKAIEVPENVAKTLYILARLVQPKNILEIGTLGAYSTLWLARALVEGGRLITIECEKRHVEIARSNIRFAEMEDKIEVREGKASSILEEMILKEEGPFDVIFIDADKVNYPFYLEPCLKLARSGTLILSDNLIPKRGEIGRPDPTDREAVGIYAYNQLLADHPLLETILLTTIVGDNGRIDALGVSLVK